MYIPFHQRTTTGVLRSMCDRALQICSYTSREPELERLKEVLQANGFPADLARKTLTSHLILALIAEPRQKPSHTLSTLYVRGLSERFERVCTSLGICTAFKPVEDTEADPNETPDTCVPEEMKTGFVYEVPSKECSKTHVGETKRTLKVRLGEHIKL